MTKNFKMMSAEQEAPSSGSLRNMRTQGTSCLPCRPLELAKWVPQPPPAAPRLRAHEGVSPFLPSTRWGTAHDKALKPPGELLGRRGSCTSVPPVGEVILSQTRELLVAICPTMWRKPVFNEKPEDDSEHRWREPAAFVFLIQAASNPSIPPLHAAFLFNRSGNPLSQKNNNN